MTEKSWQMKLLLGKTTCHTSSYCVLVVIRAGVSPAACLALMPFWKSHAHQPLWPYCPSLCLSAFFLLRPCQSASPVTSNRALRIRGHVLDLVNKNKIITCGVTNKKVQAWNSHFHNLITDFVPSFAPQFNSFSIHLSFSFVKRGERRGESESRWVNKQEKCPHLCSKHEVKLFNLLHSSNSRPLINNTPILFTQSAQLLLSAVVFQLVWVLLP